MKITNAELKIILDSRGKDTLEAVFETGNFLVKASAPSGKSRGKHEAFVLEPKKALEKFENIKKEILNKEFENQKEFDKFLISLDGTPNKENIGGNMILVLSLAFARLAAKSQNLELYEYIRKNFQFPLSLSTKRRFPLPFFNVINGGVHSGNSQSKIEFQEFQIIPQVSDFKTAFDLGKEFYSLLKEFLENKFGQKNIILGDEAGFSCVFESNEQAIAILAELIKKNGYPLRIGLDVAASQFYEKDESVYIIGGKKYLAEELKEMYLKLIENYGIISIEDPFDEESFDDFAKLILDIQSKEIEYLNTEKSDFRKLVITDDLTTTNLKRLQTALNKKAGNAILIKLNQIGTLTETLEVMKLAYEKDWRAIISHRSGETMDDFIADLAVGTDAWGIKSGAPAAPERNAKYERILKIVS
ncbi:phosphopyruvate hydratase [Candidatus Wolfebacteria bacterium]|nr:phosphopyruvate hydratase [Candidatus Wolfebacteria bacterium]